MSDLPDFPSLIWSDALLTGYGPMDSCHEEFVDVVAALRTASEDDLSVCLRAVVEHLQAHFSEEEHWMIETGFPHVTATRMSTRRYCARRTRYWPCLSRATRANAGGWLMNWHAGFPAMLITWMRRWRIGCVSAA